MLNEKIPHNIKKCRELKNITRKALADHLDMTLSGYAKIEQGNVDITLKKLESIARFLDVDVLYLIDFDASKLLRTKDINNKQMEDYEEIPFSKWSVSIDYFQKLIDSLERENALLRDKLSNTG